MVRETFPASKRQKINPTRRIAAIPYALMAARWQFDAI